MGGIALYSEADAKSLIDINLRNLGWEFDGSRKNVFRELPQHVSEHRELDRKRPDYVLYSQEIGNKPLIVIEAKRKGSRLDSALEQGINYARALKAPLVFATDGVFCKSFHTIANRPPLLNGEEINELIRESLALRYLNDYSVNTVSPKVQYSRKQLINIFDEANNMLRGEGLRAGIERFGEFANILFLKLIDENEQVKIGRGIVSRFDIACSWNVIKNIPFSVRIDYINRTVYEKLNALYHTDIFTPLQIRDASILADIMSALDSLTLTDIDSDVKGDAFEYFLRSTTSTQNDLGEYFTPRHIVKTMVRLLNPRIGEKIYDPFCGTGGFLIETFRHIYNNMVQTEANIETLRQHTIYGNEITNTARITKMNMILAGDGHSNIHMKDSLAEPVDGEYDAVITNMPYSQTTKHGNLYDIPGSNGDSICVQHCIKAVNSTAPDGRIALVVPEGFLFRKDMARVREYLLDRCELQSIISLPQGVFLPYTGVKTDIIYAVKVNQKKIASDSRKYFWYFDVKSDGYTLNNQRMKLDTPSDLSRFEEFRKLDDGQSDDMLLAGFEIVPFDKVRGNSFILVGSRYRDTKAIVFRNNSSAVRLGDVSSIIRGISFPKIAQRINHDEQSLGVITTRAAQAEGIDLEHVIYIDKSYARPDKLIIKGDILISLANSLNLVGRVTYVDKEYKDMSFGAFMGAVRADVTKIIPEYLFYILQSEKAKEYFRSVARTTTNISNLTFEDLSYFVFPLPPLEIQRAIVAELEGYQNLISGARKILKSYMPHIPRISGELKALSDIAQFRPSKEEIRNLPGDTIVSFVPMSDINTFSAEFVPQSERRLEDVFSGYTYFKDHDILLAKITPCFENGKAGIAHSLRNGIGFGSTEFIIIRANTELVYPEWIFYHINTQEFIEGGKNHMTGTAGQQRVDIEYAKKFRLPVPPLEEQRKILDDIKYEQSLVEPARQLIRIFTEKIEAKVKSLWESLE